MSDTYMELANELMTVKSLKLSFTAGSEELADIFDNLIKDSVKSGQDVLKNHALSSIIEMMNPYRIASRQRQTNPETGVVALDFRIEGPKFVLNTLQNSVSKLKNDIEELQRNASSIE